MVDYSGSLVWNYRPARAKCFPWWREGRWWWASVSLCKTDNSDRIYAYFSLDYTVNTKYYSYSFWSDLSLWSTGMCALRSPQIWTVTGSFNLECASFSIKELPTWDISFTFQNRVWLCSFRQKKKGAPHAGLPEPNDLTSVCSPLPHSFL